LNAPNDIKGWLPIHGHDVSQLSEKSRIGGHSENLKKAIIPACVLAILAAIVSTIIQVVFLPVGVDGGLYSYPALSLSRSADPRESQLSVEETKDTEGIRAIFGYDLSRTVRVLPMSWWIGAFGANIWSLRAFGLMEMALLVLLMFLALWTASKDPLIALLLWSLYITDAKVLGLGSTDPRPDIMITILTLVVFMLLDVRAEKKAKAGLLFVLSFLAMFLLSVTHVTAAISLSFLMCYMIAEMIISWHSIPRFTKRLYLSLIITGSFGFLLRRTVCAVLIPSQYLDRIGFNTVVDVKKGVIELLLGGVLPLMAKELSRWSDYFYPYNLPLLFVIFIAIFLFAANIIGSSIKKPSSSQMSILAGLISALGVLALDPHPWGAHALPLVPFFIIFLAKELRIIHNTRLKHVVISLLIAFTLLSAGAQISFAGRIVMKCTPSGFSNRAVVDLMQSIFNDNRKNYLVVGPTEIWPYINSRTNVAIFDAKMQKLDEIYRYMNKIDYFILNKDYRGYDWENRFREKYPTVALATVAEIGDENSGWPFMKVMKPVPQQ